MHKLKGFQELGGVPPSTESPGAKRGRTARSVARYFSAVQGFCIPKRAKTAQNASCFGFFFARLQKVVFFICRAVARQMTLVNDSR